MKLPNGMGEYGTGVLKEESRCICSRCQGNSSRSFVKAQWS